MKKEELKDIKGAYFIYGLIAGMVITIWLTGYEMTGMPY